MNDRFNDIALLEDSPAVDPLGGTDLFGIPDAVHICGHIYPTTQAAYDAVLRKAAETGYVEPDYAKKNRTPDSEMFFSLEDIHRAGCLHCKSVISTHGVACHGHTCEACGQPTMLEYTDGGVIRLQFMDPAKGGATIGNDICFKIREYREHADKPNELALYATPITGNYRSPDGRVGMRMSPFWVNSASEAQTLMEDAAHLYRREKIIDKETGEEINIIILSDPEPHRITDASVFNTCEIHGRIQKYETFDMWDGKRYDMFDTMPVPKTFHLSHKYIGGQKHSLAEPDIVSTIMSAAGQVSRVDFYYQDGRPAFDSVPLQRMTDFVHNFVDVKPAAWDKFLRKVSKDGPGFIRGLSAWASKMSDGVTKHIRDEPNIGNALLGMVSLMKGEPLSLEEAVAFSDGSETPEAEAFAKHLLKNHQTKKRARRRHGKLDL